jgi:hypothetical protein
LAHQSQQSRVGPWADYRRLLLVAACIAGAIALGILLRTAWNAGLNPDQEVDQRYFLNNLAGLTGTRQFGNFFNANSVQLEASYGYTFQALAFATSWAWSAISGQSFDPFATEVLNTRNVLVLLASLVVLPSVYLIARSISDKRWVGWVSVAGILLIPTFTGHAFINQKDMPLAAGFTALTAATVVFMRRILIPERQTHMGRRTLLNLEYDQWALAGLLAFGVCMTVGTRPPTAVAVAATCAVAMFVAVRHRQYLRRSDLIWAGAGLATGAIAIIATNAGATPNPAAWIVDSISIAGDFPAWRAQQLINGDRLLPEQLPRTQIIGMVLAQTPVVMLLLTGIGILGIAREVATAGPLRRQSLLWVPVMIQLALLPAGGVIQGSLFYNASRQVLFVYPMIAVIAAWGVFSLAQWLPHGAIRNLGFTVVALLALVPAIDTLTLYPYQYVYFNEATRGDLTNRYELDYWGISGPETQRWVNQNYPTAIVVNPPPWDLKRSASSGIDIVEEWPSGSDRELIWAGPWYPSWNFADYPQCPIVHETTRSLWGEDLRLGYVRRCTERL